MHQTYAETLKEVHLPSALDPTKFDHGIDVHMLSHIPCREFILSQDNQSHFYVSLQQWRRLNLSPAFIQFANKVDTLSVSIPLLLHNWREVSDLWQAAVVTAEDEALRALLEYLYLFMSP